MITLDIEKDFKAALQNDFAFFKRAFHNVKMEIKNKNAIAEEINDLQMFLADPRCPKSIILNTLKQTVVTIHGHEDVLTDIFTWCMRQIEDGLYLLPEDKWMMIRFLPHCMFLMDSDSTEKSAFNVFKAKKINTSAVTKCFNRNPVVPVFGDMHISLIYILQRCPHFEAGSMTSTWGEDDRDQHV